MIFRASIIFTYSDNPYYTRIINVNKSNEYIVSDTVENAAKEAIFMFFDDVLHELKISIEDFYADIYPNLGYKDGIPCSIVDITLFRIDRTYDFGENIVKSTHNKNDTFCIIQNVYKIHIADNCEFSISNHALVGCKYQDDECWHIDDYPYYYFDNTISTDQPYNYTKGEQTWLRKE